MTRKDPRKLIVSYRAGVQHPEASGMEHLNLLQIRSRLASLMPELSATQREQVIKADQELLTSADKFYQAIQQIADLSSWRAQENISPSHWWWYLDVIIHLPEPMALEIMLAKLPQTVL